MIIVPLLKGWIAAQYTLSVCPSKVATAISSTGPVNRVERPKKMRKNKYGKMKKNGKNEMGEKNGKIMKMGRE